MSAFLEMLGAKVGFHISLRDFILLGMSPLFLATFYFEYRYLQKRGVVEQFIVLRESVVNFLLGGTYQIAEALISLLFLAVFLSWVEQFQLFNIAVDGPLPLLALFFLTEFFYYWYHRASHRIRWFWCAHVVHHSSENMNFSTAMRQSIMYPVSGNFLFFLPVVLIGFSAEAVFAAYAVNLAYQYFIHTQQIPKLHPLVEAFFNTPSHHRAHHGRNDRYIDKNFGGVVIIFDRWFGTFVEEDETEPVDYGIPRQIHSLNLLTINFHEWIDMFRDASRPGALWQRLKHFWKPPEWKRAHEQHAS